MEPPGERHGRDVRRHDGTGSFRRLSAPAGIASGMHGGGREPVRATLEARLRNRTSATRQRQARDASWSWGNQSSHHSMINRRSVPALLRACLHREIQPGCKIRRGFCVRGIENGHDSRAMTVCGSRPAEAIILGRRLRHLTGRRASRSRAHMRPGMIPSSAASHSGMARRESGTITNVVAAATQVPAEAADPRPGRPTPYLRIMVILTFTPIFTIILRRRLRLLCVSFPFG
jgi:hypothetical protein